MAPAPVLRIVSSPFLLLALLLSATPAAAQFHQVTADAARDRFPTWTADGQSIVFESNRSGNWRLYTVSASGGAPVQLTNGPLQEMHPKVSPDGTQIAFIRSPDASPITGSMSTSSIWVMPIGGGPATQVTTSSNYLDWYPDFSPDGSTIYFTRLQGGGWSIWSVPATGGVETELTISGSQEHSGHISPDGQKIAYAFGISGSWRMGEALLSNPGVRLWETSYTGTTVPHDYSPDGSLLVFVSRKDGGKLELYERDLGTNTDTRLTYDGTPSFDPLTNGSSYSPDGTKIVFYSARITGEENIWIYDRTEPPPPPPTPNHLDIGTAAGLPGGGAVKIPVTLQNTEIASGLEFHLVDVPDNLTVTGVTTVGRASSLTAAFTDGGGDAHILVYHPTAGTIAAGSGTVLQVSVQIGGGAAVGDTIDLSATGVILSSPTGQSLDVDATNGYLVVERRDGDLNGDNQVDVGDIVRLVEIVLGTGSAPTPEELEIADCNDDAAWNILDVTCMVNLVMAGSGAPAVPPQLSPLGAAAGLTDLAIDAAEPVAGLQLFLKDGGEVVPGAGLDPLALQTGVAADGRMIVVAFDPAGQIWPAGARVPFQFDGELLEARAYGPGGRPLVVSLSGNRLAIGTSGTPVRPGFAVLPNMPNPFRGSTTLRFRTGVAGPVRIDIFDIRGARVATLGTVRLPAGDHSRTWNAFDSSGNPLPSGIYLAAITTNEGTKHVRLTHLAGSQ